uniref:Uncharacterized protein n=1 Tax=Salarias fasciatus TaxID=181472 RepID=A0A672GB14_SALFA
MNTISGCSQGPEGVRFGNHRISSLLFADVVLLCKKEDDKQPAPFLPSHFYKPCCRMTLSETDSVRRESYKQQQVVHFLVERSPGQTLKLGRDGGVMTRNQLPLSPTSRAPHGANAAAFDRRVQQPVASEEEWDSWETSDLIKPARENFRASGLMSSPRHASHRAPKRE